MDRVQTYKTLQNLFVSIFLMMIFDQNKYVHIQSKSICLSKSCSTKSLKEDLCRLCFISV